MFLMVAERENDDDEKRFSYLQRYIMNSVTQEEIVCLFTYIAILGE